MPKANNEVLVLDDIIQNCLDLYGDNDQVNVTFEHNEDDPVHIEADRDQISRVYINLITNAIQAIPENRKGNRSFVAFNAGGVHGEELVRGGSRGHERRPGI